MCSLNKGTLFFKQGSICETRKGPNYPPILKGIEYFVYAHECFEKSQLLVILAKIG